MENLKVIKINNDIRRQSQVVYAKAFKEALDSGMQLSLEAEEILKNRGLLDTSKEDALAADLRGKIKKLEVLLYSRRNSDGSSMTREQGREIAMQMKKVRNELQNVGARKSDLLNNTAETYAQNEQMQYFIYACTIDTEKGDRYWDSFEAFKDDSESEAVSYATRKLITQMAGVDEDYEKALPENKWLIRMGYMNNDLQFINKEGRPTDSEGRLIDEEGRYINEDGEFVDIYGNKIDEKGNLLLEDNWADEYN